MDWVCRASNVDVHRVLPESQFDALRHGTSGALQSPYNQAVAATRRLVVAKDNTHVLYSTRRCFTGEQLREGQGEEATTRNASRCGLRERVNQQTACYFWFFDNRIRWPGRSEATV